MMFPVITPSQSDFLSLTFEEGSSPSFLTSQFPNNALEKAKRTVAHSYNEGRSRQQADVEIRPTYRSETVLLAF